MNYENTIIDNQAILEFRDGVEREVRSCKDALKRMAQKIQQMQILDGFEGEAAESIKTYFSEVHLFLLEAIGEALTECESMLNQYAMEILCNVDSSPYARIPVSDLLGMQDQVKNRYLDMDGTIDSVNKLMNGIQDLVQVDPIQTEVGSTGGPFAMPRERTLSVSYDRDNIVKSAIVNGNSIGLLEHCEEVRSILKESVDKIDQINFDYALDKIPLLEDYVKILDGSIAEYSDIARNMENYNSGDYNKWDSTKCLSDQMLLYSLYYTTNQEEILLAKETLQQVSMEMQQVENKAKKDNTISVAKEIGSFGISLIPFLGDGKDLQESISGLDLITGKKLSALERVLAGACVIVPVISGSMVRIAGKNADIAEKMSLLSEKQLFKKAGKGITMCEDAKKEMEQLIQGIRNMLEEDADIKRLFAKNKNTGPQVEIAGVGKVSLEEAEKLVGKDVRWSRGESVSKVIGKAGVGKTGKGIPLEKVKPEILTQIHPDDNGAYGYIPNKGTAYNNPKYDFTDVNWAMDMQSIRKEYLKASKQLEYDIERMTSKGFSKEDIAKHVVNVRNQQKVTARANMTIEERNGLEARNIKLYGNPIGPDSQWLFNKTKKKLIKEGTYISDENVWSIIIKKSMKKDDVINTLLGLIH